MRGQNDLTFSNMFGASASVEAELPKKVLCGLQTCQHVLSIEKDFHDLFTMIGKKSRRIQRRTETIIPTITSPTGEMVGFLKAYESLTGIITTMSTAAEAFTSTIEKRAAEPLAATLEDLFSRKNEFLVQRHSRSGSGSDSSFRKTSPFESGAVANFPPQIVVTSTHAATPTSPDVENSRKRQKLYDRLLLANEEYQKAVESRDAIVGRFGSSIKPGLKEKVEERVKRAGHLKGQAERELGAFDDEAGAPTAASSINNNLTNAPYEIVSNGYSLVDTWELDRLAALRKSFVDIAKGLFLYQKQITNLVIHFAHEVDQFHPQLDKTMWISQVLQYPSDLHDMKRSLDSQITPIISQNEIASLSLTVVKDSDTDEMSYLRSSLYDSQKQLIHQCEERRRAEDRAEDAEAKLSLQLEENEKLRSQNQILKQDFKTKSHQSMSIPASSPTVTPGASPRREIEKAPEQKPKEKRKRWGGLLGVGSSSTSPKPKKEKIPPDEPGGPPDVSPLAFTDRSSGGARGGLQGEVRSEALSKKLSSSDLRSSHQLTPSSDKASFETFMEHPANEGDHLGGTETPGFPASRLSDTHESDLLSIAHMSRSISIGDEEIKEAVRTTDPEIPVPQKRTEFLPDLFSHLSAPVEQYSGAAEAEYFIEIQRRYEEFLLALRNFELSSYVRTQNWAETLHYKGPAVEEAFRYFPYKLPGGISMDISREPYFMALEWGAPKLDEVQWSCIAYETLLLVYLHLSNQSAAKELCQLPERDLNSVSAKEYASRIIAPNINHKTIATDRNPAAQGRRKSAAINALTSGDVVPPQRQPQSEEKVMDEKEIESAISEDNLQIIKKLVTLTRIKLGLAGRVNSLIVQLTLPSGSEFGRMGQWCSIHPLDVRYRVVRLLDTWYLAASVHENGKPLGKNASFRLWLLRQIHVIHTAICYKLWRLIRFLPKKRGVFEAFNGWGENGPWHRSFGSGGLPRFPKEVDRFFSGRLNTLIRLSEMGLQILSALATAAEEMNWGVEIEDPESISDLHRTASGIGRLLQLMTCISSLDRLIRVKIAEDERGLTAGAFQGLIINSPRLRPRLQYGKSLNDMAADEPTVLLDDDKKKKEPTPDKSKLRHYTVQSSEEFTAIMHESPQPDVLSLYWSYEVPLLQLVLSFLWKAVADGTTGDALHVDGPALANGLLVAAYTTQIGIDPSCNEEPIPFHVATLSVQTHCLLLVDAIWNDACASRTISSSDSISDLDIELGSGSGRHVVGVIPTNALRTIIRLMDVDEFSEWFCNTSQTEALQQEASQPTQQNRRSSLGSLGPHQAIQIRRYQEISSKRSDRLICYSSPDPWDTLCRDRGQGRRFASLTSRDTGLSWMQDEELNDATDPDFFVVDVLDIHQVKLMPEKEETTPSFELQRTLTPRYEGQSITHKGQNDSSIRTQAIKEHQHRKAIQEWMDEGHPDQIVSDAEQHHLSLGKVKRKTIWNRRRKRRDTREIQNDILALEFDEEMDGSTDQEQTVSTSPNPLTSPPLSPRQLPQDVPRMVRSSGSRKTDRRDAVHQLKNEGAKSRIRIGYDVLHNAGMKLTSENYPKLFESLENIREEPEGISLIFPSRIERVMMEVLYNRLISSRFRGEIANVLCDYRYQLEPEALPLMVTIWEKLHRSMFNDIPEIPPVAPEITQFNINVPLPELLSGPSPKYDLYRYFIYQSVVSLLNRLFTDARIAVSRDPRHDIQELMTYPEESSERREALNECGEVAKVYGESIKGFVNEIRGELEFYPKYWKDLLPCNQHALIVVYASRLALFSSVSELLESPYWPEEDVPPYGSTVLEGIQSFERLVREVKIGTRLELSSEPDLLQNLTDSLTAALTKRFQAVEQTLKRCMKSETWEPTAGEMHSIAVIDLFSFIHHLFHAIVDLHAPINLMVPCFLQFLGRLSQDYSDYLLSDCNDENILASKDAADFVFNNLHNPAARVEGVGGFISLVEATKKKKAPGAGVLKQMGKLAAGWGFGIKKKKATSQTTSPARGPGATEEAQVETPRANEGNINGALGKTPNFGGFSGFSGSTTSDLVLSGELSGIESEPQSEISGKTQKPSKSKKKKKKKKPTSYTQIALPDNFSELATRFGQQPVLRYVQIKQAFAKSPLKHWLVRLHNLKFFCNQLPGLALKFKELTESLINMRDPRCKQIIQALNEAEGRAVKQHKLSRPDSGSSGFLDLYEDATLLDRLQGILEGAIASCQKAVLARAQHVCRYISLRIVYYDFGEDFFEELYNPAFKRYTLENILSAFKDTVERFISSAPDEFQGHLRQYIVEDISKCWMSLLTELGYQGIVFMSEDMEVLDEDLEALRDYCNRQNVLPDIILNDDTPQARTVNMFDYINDFFCLISSKPQVLAQLGGNYNTSKTKQREEEKVPLAFDDAIDFTGVQDPTPIPLESMFGLGETDLTALAGEDTKKKKKKGWAKLLGF